MLTREEYKKTYIRMMDSNRILCKGARSCAGISCDKCPLSSVCNETESKAFQAFETIELVEQWGKDHPVTTNGDKFMEVFGIKPRDDGCFRHDSVPCPNYLCKDCEFGVNGEYHAPECVEK